MRYFLILFGVLLLTSCGSYRVHQRGPEITHVLALTSEGDTLKVPIQDLQRKMTILNHNMEKLTKVFEELMRSEGKDAAKETARLLRRMKIN